MSTPTNAYLVLIETTGNQGHIFETNKLAENVGASQQIFQLGQAVVLDAVQSRGHPKLKQPEEVQDKIKNPLLERGTADVEVWYVSSGKAMLFTQSRAVGVEIVREVTTRALKEFPGVVVRGAVSERPVNLVTAQCVHDAVQEIHERLERKRSELPPDELRFQRLPVVGECGTSGLPACCVVHENSQDVIYSTVSLRKRELKATAFERMSRLLGKDLTIADNVEELDRWSESTRFLAVIHADGNGIGRIFQDFVSHAQSTDGRDYIQKLRLFSQAIDQCTRAAFQAAVAEVAQSDSQFLGATTHDRRLKVPVLPLIVGGDDLTLVTDGRYAIPLVAAFLRHFERMTEEHKDIKPIANHAFGVGRLGMTAGIAFVKPHYPFYSAYHLAEELLQSAKSSAKQQVATSTSESPFPITGFDFHVQHSSSGDALASLREERGGTRLWGGPYIVSPDAESDERLSDSARQWIKPRTWKSLKDKIKTLTKPDSDDSQRDALPMSHAHDLRSALFDGPESFQTRLYQISHRYPNCGLENLFRDGQAFWTEAVTERQVTAFLDALTLAKLGIVAMEADESPTAVI